MSNDFGDNYEKRERYDYTTDPYRNEPKKGYGCWTGCGCGCLIFLLALIVGGFLVYNICLKGSPLQVSPETTVITEPLKSDGKNVDFFKVVVDISEPKIPAEENGFKNVLEAYGKQIFESQFGVQRDWPYEETCRHFGLDPTALKPTSVFEDAPEQFVRKTPKADEKPKADENAEDAKDEMSPLDDSDARAEGYAESFVHLADTPWTVEERPTMKEWLEKVSPGLDIVQQAGLKEHYFIPMVRRNDKEVCLATISQDAFQFHIRLSQGIRIRAMNRLATGETEKAWKDILASLRIYRQVLAGADFVSGLEEQTVNTALNRELVETVVRHDRWTPELLTQAIADMEKLPKWPENKDFIRVFQFLLLDAVSSTGDMKNLLESFSPEQVDDDAARAAGIVGFNWNLVAKKMNEQFADLEGKVDGKTFKEILETFGDDPQARLEAEMHARFSGRPGDVIFKLLTVGGRSEFTGDIVGRIMTLLAGRIIVEEIHEEIHCRLLHAALALEKHKLQKKNYPDSLEALDLKEFEPSISIQYEKTGTGYVLSVGDIKIER